MSGGGQAIRALFDAIPIGATEEELDQFLGAADGVRWVEPEDIGQFDHWKYWTRATWGSGEVHIVVSFNPEGKVHRKAIQGRTSYVKEWTSTVKGWLSNLW